MKNLYTLALILLCAFVGKAQIINIPDAAFKAKLLAADTTNNIAYNSNLLPIKIDSNNDGEIQMSEALVVCRLFVGYGTIANLVGIESFPNLTHLNCSQNQLTTLNVVGLTNLQDLRCDNNLLSSISVIGLTNLHTLDCSYNQLTILDTSGDYNVLVLFCNNNLLTDLDISNLIHINSY